MYEFTRIMSTFAKKLIPYTLSCRLDLSIMYENEQCYYAHSQSGSLFKAVVTRVANMNFRKKNYLFFR